MTTPPTHDPVTAPGNHANVPGGNDAQPARVLSPAAQRALAEAEERRRQAQEAAAALPPEVDGPKGVEPTRYGDWERKGISYDF